MVRNTGGTKHDGNKTRVELVHPDFMFATAEVLTFGAKKYAPWNWAGGFDWSRVYGALQRHLNAWWSGENKDPETGLSHLAHAACDLMFLVTFERRRVGRDDRFIFPTTTNVCLPVPVVHEEASLSSKPPELPRKLHSEGAFQEEARARDVFFAIERDTRSPDSVLVRWQSDEPMYWYNVSMERALSYIYQQQNAPHVPEPKTARSAQVVKVNAGWCDGCSQEPQSCRCPNEGQNSSGFHRVRRETESDIDIRTPR